MWALSSWKRRKAFRIAQCKQLRLIKPCLNYNLYFITKTSSIALLETTVSYKPLPSLSQKDTKYLLPALLDVWATQQPYCASSPQFWIVARQIKRIQYWADGITGQKYFWKLFFVTKKVIKKQRSVAWNFLQPPIPVCRGIYIPYFKINTPIFCCPLFSGNYLNLQVRINKMVN